MDQLLCLHIVSRERELGTLLDAVEAAGQGSGERIILLGEAGALR